MEGPVRSGVPWFVFIALGDGVVVGVCLRFCESAGVSGPCYVGPRRNRRTHAVVTHSAHPALHTRGPAAPRTPPP
jgi:hypothetical protein